MLGFIIKHMGMTEKNSLINEITLKLVEDYGLPIKEVKSKISDMLQSYHITISDEGKCGTDFSTDYLMKKFSDGKSAVGMSDKTLQQYRIAISKLESVSGKQMSDVESEDINRFLRDYGKTVSDVTLKSKYQLISSVYNYLYQHRYIPHNPVTASESPKATVVYQEPLSRLSVEKIKSAIEHFPEKESVRDMAMIHFFISTGCRVSELCNVRIGDLDLNTRICKVVGKGKKERPVALNENACYRIKMYLDTRKDTSSNAPLFASIRGKEKKISKDGVERIMKKISKSAGIERLSCHMFRRYYATELRRRGVNIQMIATSLGHANLNQINRYSLYNSSEMLNVVRDAI